VRYDLGWWREFWKRTRVQGATINGGGIVADYPSKYPLQGGADFLGDRDLYGELAKAAHDDGLAVAARMDSNRTAAVFLGRIPTGSPETPAAIRIARRINTTGCDFCGQEHAAETGGGAVSWLHRQPGAHADSVRAPFLSTPSSTTAGISNCRSF